MSETVTKTCDSPFTRTGEPCQRKAGWGTEHFGRGRCSDHDNSIPNPRQERFLKAISIHPSISAAARVVGIKRSAHYDWMNCDPTYPERFREAQARGVDVIEDRAFEWTLMGGDGDKLEPPTTPQVRLAIFLLSNLIPRHNRKLRVETTDADKIIDALRRAGDRRGLERIQDGESPAAVLADRLEDLRSYLGDEDPEDDGDGDDDE